MTHAHFSKYPISDLSHPKVACRRTMRRARRPIFRVIYTVSERVFLFAILETVMGLNNAFFYRDGPPLHGDKLCVKLLVEKR